VLATAFALFVAGCAGGGRLSAREYVGRASAICTRATSRVEGFRLVEVSDTPWREVAHMAAVQDHAASELADLHPPRQLVEFDTVWVALVRQSASELERMAKSLRRGEIGAATAQARAVGQLANRGRALAEAHGIVSCAAPAFVAV
jgi:hypothetical protein